MRPAHLSRRRIATAATSLACLSLAATPGVASAHKPATGATRTAILAAVVKQKQLSAAQAACVSVTLSTVNVDWAALSFPAHLSKACQKVAANGTIIEHYTAGSWHFATDGSDLSDTSGGMPKAVGKDLLG